MTGTAAEIVKFLFDQDKTKVWDIKEHKERRSLDANAYFHVLCDKLRLKLGISMARCKNHLIADYGQVQYLPDGSPMIYKTNAPEDYMMELETIHSKLLKVNEENGKEVFFYRIYRGSHEYNTAEMSRLIDGLVSECKGVGIETETPERIAQMMKMYGRKHG